MFKPTGEARIALMSKKDLRKDLLEEILSWVPRDKNSKSPVVDLLSNTSMFKQIIRFNPFKSASFTWCRYHVLQDIHNRDLRINYKTFNNDYNSVVHLHVQGERLLGRQSRGLIYKRCPDGSCDTVGYYDLSKFRAKYDKDDEAIIIGFFGKGIKGGGLISVEQAQAESTYNGWNDK
jgi:hypothetical protein